jgi:isoleucyl-tRNA synthetase
MSDSESRSGQRYPNVPAQANFPALEGRVLETWQREKIFERSVEQRPAGENGANEYVFYDGPPFANGTPHFGHLLTGYVKDIIPRYQTLQGRRVERRFGWDCHGLPAEMEAQRELGVSSRAEIQEYGIGRFNDYCRTSVLRYTEHWQETMTRAGRWVDFKNDYKTMDLSYMESLLWAFKQLWEKGLMYEGYSVLPYSWAAETPLSNFETRLDDATRERQDPAITVRFELQPDGDGHPTDLLAWTTTPWTLPSNLALAVGPEIEYAVLELAGRRIILGAACVEKYATELGEAQRVGSVRGSELAGRRYRPLFPFFADTWLQTSSIPKRAPAWCTWRRASARTTWRPARRRASRSSCRWTSAGASPSRCLPGPASWSSTPTSPSSGSCASAGCCCATKATSTTTRTAGARIRL